MKLISLLIIFNGLGILFDSINRLYTNNFYKYGTTLINEKFCYFGIFLGIVFLIIGLGLKKSKYFYTSAIILYTLMISYALINIILFITKNMIELCLIPLYFLPVLYYFIILISLLKINKINYKG